MKDYVGLWFEIYRRHQEPSDIAFKIVGANGTEQVLFPHEKADGAGALFCLAEARNWKIQSAIASGSVPAISLFTYIQNILLFLYWTKSRRKNIWPFAIAKSTSGQPNKTAIHFSTEETEKLKQAAKSKSVSWNSLLFYELHQTIAEIFQFDTEPKSWWIPVNMRRELGLDPNDPNLKKNYVSNFTIDVRRGESLSDFHALIGKSLKQKKHWGTWWWQHLGKVLPESAIEKIALQNLKDNHYVGAFTNLGEWTCSTQTQLTLFANTLLSHPVAGSAIIWNGEMNLGVSTYPTFQGSSEKIAAVWEKRIRSYF